MRSSSNPLSLTVGSISLESRPLTSLCAALLSQARSMLSLLLTWTLVCQTMMLGAPHYWRSQGEPGSRSASDATAQWQTIDSIFTPDDANSPPSSLPSTTSVADGIAVVRHAPSINGNGKVEGSLRQLAGESVTLNGGGTITDDLQVPGTPTLLLNGNPVFGGTIEGAGSPQPTNYQVTLNGGGATLGHLVTRTDPISLPSIPPPPASQGTRSVTINSLDEDAGDFATLLDLTLNGNVGMLPVIPGTYRNFNV